MLTSTLGKWSIPELSVTWLRLVTQQYDTDVSDFQTKPK